MNSIIAALYGDPSQGTPVDVSPTSSFEYFRELQAAREAEAARLAELERAQAEFDAAGSVEDRSKNLINNMYGGYNGEFGGRVLTPDEIQFGYTNALGAYVEGRPTLAQLGLTEEKAQQIRYRNLSHDWYRSGMDHFEQPFELTNEWDISDNSSVYGNPEWMKAASSYVNDLAGQNTISPWLNTFQQDRIGTYNLIKDADYNAFLGGFGERQSAVDGYRDDSIAGWFKNAFSEQDQIRNRGDAIRELKLWNRNEDRGGYGLNKATDAMTKQYFDQMDLANKFGLTWEQAAAVIDSNSGTTNTGATGSGVTGTGATSGGDNGQNSGNGMLSNQDSTWQDVISRGGASLENWDSLLGQYTYDSPLNWADMSNQEVENSFGNLFDSGGMFTQGKNRDLIYAKLMENLGRV